MRISFSFLNPPKASKTRFGRWVLCSQSKQTSFGKLRIHLALTSAEMQTRLGPEHRKSIMADIAKLFSAHELA